MRSWVIFYELLLLYALLINTAVVWISAMLSAMLHKDAISELRTIIAWANNNDTCEIDPFYGSNSAIRLNKHGSNNLLHLLGLLCKRTSKKSTILQNCNEDGRYNQNRGIVAFYTDKRFHNHNWARNQITKRHWNDLTQSLSCWRGRCSWKRRFTGFSRTTNRIVLHFIYRVT